MYYKNPLLLESRPIHIEDAIKIANKLDKMYPKRNWFNPGSFHDIVGLNGMNLMNQSKKWSKVQEILQKRQYKRNLSNQILKKVSSTRELDDSINREIIKGSGALRVKRALSKKLQDDYW